jgi:hypothetical protein
MSTTASKPTTLPVSTIVSDTVPSSRHVLERKDSSDSSKGAVPFVPFVITNIENINNITVKVTVKKQFSIEKHPEKTYEISYDDTVDELIKKIEKDTGIPDDRIIFPPSSGVRIEADTNISSLIRYSSSFKAESMRTNLR